MEISKYQNKTEYSRTKKKLLKIPHLQAIISGYYYYYFIATYKRSIFNILN